VNANDDQVPCLTLSPGGWLRCTTLHLTGENPYTGKWMMWPTCRAAHQCWQYIRDPTSNGEPGIAAKISDRRACPEGEHLVCVYTADWKHLQDLEGVALQLCAGGATDWIGRPRPLYYKADEQTYRGLYSSAGVPASLFSFDPATREMHPQRGL
jgi:hypothetical protein